MRFFPTGMPWLEDQGSLYQGNIPPFIPFFISFSMSITSILCTLYLFEDVQVLVNFYLCIIFFIFETVAQEITSALWPGL